MLRQKLAAFLINERASLSYKHYAALSEMLEVSASLISQSETAKANLVAMRNQAIQHYNLGEITGLSLNELAYKMVNTHPTTNKIQFLKDLRVLTDCGLKEAKDAIDAQFGV